MKRIICTIITLALIMSIAPVSGVFAAGELSWEMPAGYYLQEKLFYRPVNNYHSYQNSPCFTWPIVYGSTYELVLCDDAELKSIVYEVKDIPVNMYTFPHTIESGRDYYWAVRYKLKGKYSVYSEPRRFYLDENAVEFTVAPVDDIGATVSSKKHPYFLMEDDLERIAKIDQNDTEYLKMKMSLDAMVNAGRFSVPEVSTPLTAQSAMGYINPSRDILQATSFYYITGEEKYKKYAIEGLNRAKDYKPEDYFEFNSMTDTAESIFAYNLALAYDMLYEFLSEEQIANTIKLIENNLKRPYEHFTKNSSYERSLYAEPFGSHQWRLNQCLVAGLTIYNESEMAKKLVDFHFPVLANLTYPYAYEDGASAQGPFYGLPTALIMVADRVGDIGLAGISDKGYFYNQMLNYIYLWPSGWYNMIGDAYNDAPQSAYQMKQITLQQALGNKSQEYREYAKWFLKRINKGNTQFYYSSDPDYITLNANQDVKIRAPYTLPSAKFFPDPGWIAMYSDLKDDKRIGMTFKSSWYGSHNHSHPDQNSFVIQAYGDIIASDSDYYVAYHDNFDLGWNKKTYAHNAITYDNGSGQPCNAISAKGEITGFVNQRDFKLAVGDAEVAYGTAIDKADRYMIYINPETFIVIDDLSTGGGEYNFENWINTKCDIEFYDNLKGATITGRNSAMEVRAHWPEKVTPYYIDYFAGPDLSAVAPPKPTEKYPDKRLYFQTEKTNATKLVTTLDIHKKEEKTRNIKEEKFDDYLKLSFEDGTVCYVNLTDKEKIITKDSIEFTGTAFILNSESWMSVNGTYAMLDGTVLYESDVPVSVAKGREELSISNIGSEANLKVNFEEKPGKLIKHIDKDFYEVTEGKTSNGIIWNWNDGICEFNLFPGTRTLYTDKRVVGGKSEGVLKVIIDGKTTEIPYETELDINGLHTYDFWPNQFEGLYIVEGSKNISGERLDPGTIYSVTGENVWYLTDKEAEIRLKSANANKVESIVTDDHNAVADLPDVKKRATDYTDTDAKVSVVWWERIKNNTLQGFNSAMSTISYTFDVPEDGEYDIIMSLSTVDGATSDKMFMCGDQIGSFNVPATPVYSDLQGLRVKSKLNLKKGENVIKLINLDNGQCIFDWIGLVKSSK